MNFGFPCVIRTPLWPREISDSKILEWLYQFSDFNIIGCICSWKPWRVSCIWPLGMPWCLLKSCLVKILSSFTGTHPLGVLCYFYINGTYQESCFLTWKSCLTYTWHAPGYQRCLLNTSGKLRMCNWVLDPCKEHLLRGHWIFLLIICVPDCCHFSLLLLTHLWWGDILWSPHRYLIGGSA